MKSNIRYITVTALLLALCVLFQSIRSLFPVLAGFAIFGPFNVSVLIIGSLVNLTLIIAAWRVGLWSGVAVGVLATVIAFFQGQLPNPVMMPIVAAGNVVLVLAVWLLRNKNSAAAVVTGAVAKFLALWAMVVWVGVPFMTQAGEAQAKLANIAILFSWPQLITALIGGALACLIWPRLKKARV